METAYVHCRPGGAALFVPDHIKEKFRPSTDHGAEDSEDGRALRYLEWTYDPDPGDTTYTVDYAYLLREPDDSIRLEHARHIEGLFSRESWLRLLRKAGFQARKQPFVHSKVEPGSVEMFLAVRPPIP